MIPGEDTTPYNPSRARWGHDFWPFRCRPFLKSDKSLLTKKKGGDVAILGMLPASWILHFCKVGSIMKSSCLDMVKEAPFKVAPKILNNSNGVGPGCRNHEIISYPLYYPSFTVVILIYRFTLSCQKMWVRIGRFGWMPNKFPRLFEGSKPAPTCFLFAMWSWSGRHPVLFLYVSMTWKDVWSTWNHFNILTRPTMWL